MNDAFLMPVFSIIHQIPKGKVATYGDIARMAGYPGYARHVGKALGRLPKDSQLPWFRVVNAKGELSLSGGDHQRQKALLESEGVRFTAQQRLSLRLYRWQP